MIVLDASAVVELVLATELGRGVAGRLADGEVSLHAPHVLDVEAAQAVCRYVRAGQVSEERGRLALECLAALDIERWPHGELRPRAWQLRNKLTAHDAAYVALAEALGAPLLTGDRSLAGAAGHTAAVVVGD